MVRREWGFRGRVPESCLILSCRFDFCCCFEPLLLCLTLVSFPSCFVLFITLALHSQLDPVFRKLVHRLIREQERKQNVLLSENITKHHTPCKTNPNKKTLYSTFSQQRIPSSSSSSTLLSSSSRTSKQRILSLLLSNLSHRQLWSSCRSSSSSTSSRRSRRSTKRSKQV